LNEEYLQMRIKQVKSLFAFLQNHITREAECIISVGCGVAPEFDLFAAKVKVGIDHNPSMVDFCKRTRQGTFVYSDAIGYLGTLHNESVNLILALDIDTNILPVLLVSKALPKLKREGALILTEREDNARIYGRMLLLPFIKDIKKEFSQYRVQAFTRFNKEPDKQDRDNVMMVIQKQ